MGAGGVEPAGTNAIFLLGGSIDRLDLLIVLSMASAAFRLASFLDLPLPVHSKLPTVTLVSNVLWWGGPSPFVISNSGFCRPFLATTSWRWPMGLLCGASAAVVVHFWKTKQWKQKSKIIPPLSSSYISVHVVSDALPVIRTSLPYDFCFLTQTKPQPTDFAHASAKPLSS